MKKLGLTGNIGCGKSTVANMFKECGAHAIDADRIVDGLYLSRGSVYYKIIGLFGKGILDADGYIDKSKIAKTVFSDSAQRRVLEGVVHPALRDELGIFYNTVPDDAVAVIEASLIFETNSGRNYDKVAVVYAPFGTCRERVIGRGLTEEDFLKRWANQMPIEEKLRLADFRVDNSGDLEATAHQVEKIYGILKGS